MTKCKCKRLSLQRPSYIPPSGFGTNPWRSLELLFCWISAKKSGYGLTKFLLQDALPAWEHKYIISQLPCNNTVQSGQWKRFWNIKLIVPSFVLMRRIVAPHQANCWWQMIFSICSFMNYIFPSWRLCTVWVIDFSLRLHLIAICFSALHLSSGLCGLFKKTILLLTFHF